LLFIAPGIPEGQSFISADCPEAGDKHMNSRILTKIFFPFIAVRIFMSLKTKIK
jgi:hypothetical protein